MSLFRLAVCETRRAEFQAVLNCARRGQFLRTGIICAKRRGRKHVSVEALAFVKTMELGDVESAAARLIMYVIGENTFNDSFRCVLPQEQIAFESGRISVRTLRRQLDALSGLTKDPETGEPTLTGTPFIKRTPRFDCAGARIEDEIEIVGFGDWYLERTKARKSRVRDSAPTGQNDRAPTGQNDRSPPDTAMSGPPGQQVSGHKEDRTRNRTSEEARERAPSEDSNFDLEGKGVRDRLLERHGPAKFGAWFSNLRFAVSTEGFAICTAQTRMVRDWVRKTYEADVLAACRAQWPTVTRVEFVWMSPAVAGAKEVA